MPRKKSQSLSTSAISVSIAEGKGEAKESLKELNELITQYSKKGKKREEYLSRIDTFLNNLLNQIGPHPHGFTLSLTLFIEALGVKAPNETDNLPSYLCEEENYCSIANPVIHDARTLDLSISIIKKMIARGAQTPKSHIFSLLKLISSVTKPYEAFHRKFLSQLFIIDQSIDLENPAHEDLDDLDFYYMLGTEYNAGSEKDYSSYVNNVLLYIMEDLISLIPRCNPQKKDSFINLEEFGVILLYQLQSIATKITLLESELNPQFEKYFRLLIQLIDSYYQQSKRPRYDLLSNLGFAENALMSYFPDAKSHFPSDKIFEPAPTGNIEGDSQLRRSLILQKIKGEEFMKLTKDTEAYKAFLSLVGGNKTISLKDIISSESTKISTSGPLIDLFGSAVKENKISSVSDTMTLSNEKEKINNLDLAPVLIGTYLAMQHFLQKPEYARHRENMIFHLQKIMSFIVFLIEKTHGFRINGKISISSLCLLVPVYLSSLNTRSSSLKKALMPVIYDLIVEHDEDPKEKAKVIAKAMGENPDHAFTYVKDKIKNKLLATYERLSRPVADISIDTLRLQSSLDELKKALSIFGEVIHRSELSLEQREKLQKEYKTNEKFLNEKLHYYRTLSSSSSTSLTRLPLDTKKIAFDHLIQDNQFNEAEALLSSYEAEYNKKEQDITEIGNTTQQITAKINRIEVLTKALQTTLFKKAEKNREEEQKQVREMEVKTQKELAAKRLKEEEKALEIKRKEEAEIRREAYLVAKKESKAKQEEDKARVEAEKEIFSRANRSAAASSSDKIETSDISIVKGNFPIHSEIIRQEINVLDKIISAWATADLDKKNAIDFITPLHASLFGLMARFYYRLYQIQENKIIVDLRHFIFRGGYQPITATNFSKMKNSIPALIERAKIIKTHLNDLMDGKKITLSASLLDERKISKAMSITPSLAFQYTNEIRCIQNKNYTINPDIDRYANAMYVAMLGKYQRFLPKKIITEKERIRGNEFRHGGEVLPLASSSGLSSMPGTLFNPAEGETSSMTTHFQIKGVK